MSQVEEQKQQASRYQEKRQPREPREPREPKEPKDTNELQTQGDQQRVKREPREPRGDKKETREPREKREPREPRPLYVPKGEKGEGVQQNQELTEDQQRKRDERKEQQIKKKNERQSKYVFDKSSVTLETVVPELPKKHDLIAQPKREDLEKKLDDLDKLIDKTHEHMHNYNDEVRKTMSGLKDKKDTIPLREVLRAKVAQRKEVREEFNKIQAEFDSKKVEWEEVFDQSTKLRQKMNNMEQAEDISKKLIQLKDKQQNQYMSVQEEKALIKQISQLEQSLPLAEPLSVLNKRLEKIKKEKGALGQVMNEMYTRLKKFDAEISEYKNDLDKLFEQKNESQKSLDPTIQAKRQEFKDKIEQLKKKKQDARDAFNKQYDDYDEQQDFINHTEWLQRQKERLLKDEKRKQIEEEKRQREEKRAKRNAELEAKEKQEEEEEKSKEKVNPFLGQIELCEQLIAYCKNLKPQVKGSKQESVVLTKEQIEAKLKSDEWKKEKVTVMKSIAEREDDEWNAMAKGKKNKQAKKPQQQEQPKPEPSQGQLNHGYQTLGFFDQVKVPIPYAITELDKAIDSLEQRLSYYKNPPQEDLENKQAPTEQKPKEKAKKQAKAQNLQINEEDFPTF